MLAFDTLFAVMAVLVKKALDNGLNPVVLIALRQFVAVVVLAPIAYFRERFVRNKQLNLQLVFQLLVVSAFQV